VCHVNRANEKKLLIDDNKCFNDYYMYSNLPPKTN
jgi:hypothetical protein